MKKRIIAAILSISTIFSAVPSFAMNIIPDAVPNECGVAFTSVILSNPCSPYDQKIRGTFEYIAIQTILERALNEYNKKHSINCWEDILYPSGSITDYPSYTDLDSYSKNIVDTIIQNMTDNQAHSTDNSVPEYSNDSIKDNSAAEQMLALVNKEREAQGLNSLSLDTKLTQAAQYKAEDMAKYGFSHDGSYGGLQDLLNKFNVSYTSAGENIAAGQTDCSEVMNDWMNSEGHRDNILNSSYTKLGVGCYNDGNTIYWVQEFIG